MDSTFLLISRYSHYLLFGRIHISARGDVIVRANGFGTSTKINMEIIAKM